MDRLRWGRRGMRGQLEGEGVAKEKSDGTVRGRGCSEGRGEGMDGGKGYM